MGDVTVAASAAACFTILYEY